MSANESTNINSQIEPFDLKSAGPRNARAERRARKMLMRHSQKCLGEVSRVVFRLEDDTLYVINKPDVYKNQRFDTYLIFGCLKELSNNDFDETEDLQICKSASEIEHNIAKLTAEQKSARENGKINGSEEIEDIDESGLNDLDIDLIMCQAGVPRARAVEALRKNNNDLVNTIMDLVY